MADLSRTAAALVAYDAGKTAREELFRAVFDQSSLDTWQAAERAAEDAVRQAFWLDTQEINQRARAYLVHPDDPWLRGLVDNFVLNRE